MKIKFNHTFVVYFINNNMTLDANEEKRKIIKVVNVDAFDYSKHMENNATQFNSRVNFLWNILNLTIKYPQIESYLKDLLNHFTVNELQKLDHSKLSILHDMANYPSDISLNTFEIIINFGINFKNKKNNMACHILLRNECNNHNNSILNLFIKHGIVLNTKNQFEDTILDMVVMCRTKLSEETKNCVMLLVDFGAKTNNLYDDDEIYDFIKYYVATSIKPAIKNENKI